MSSIADADRKFVGGAMTDAKRSPSEDAQEAIQAFLSMATQVPTWSDADLRALVESRLPTRAQQAAHVLRFRAGAAEAVRRVASHDALVAACEAVQKVFPRCSNPASDPSCPGCKAHALLAAALALARAKK